MKIWKVIIQRTKEWVLKVLDDMIADMKSNKRIQSYCYWIGLKYWKLNISLFFISESYFKVPKTIILNATYYFIMKICIKRELQQVASNRSPDMLLNMIKMLRCKGVLPEKDLLEKTSRMKRFEYSSLGKVKSTNWHCKETVSRIKRSFCL